MSANVDKAQQIRPPIAMYSLEATTDVQVFYIPGVPMDITGGAPEGAHTMLTNFISIQSVGAPVINGVWVRFFGSPTPPNPIQIAGDPGFIDPGSTATSAGPNPVVDNEAPLYIPGGTTVRFDMSQLFMKGVGDARYPIQYLSYLQNTGESSLRIWRSSGR